MICVRDSMEQLGVMWLIQLKVISRPHIETFSNVQVMSKDCLSLFVQCQWMYSVWID